jgi:hypothetical protein
MFLRTLQALEVLHHDLTEMTDQRDEAEERAKIGKDRVSALSIIHWTFGLTLVCLLSLPLILKSSSVLLGLRHPMTNPNSTISNCTRKNFIFPLLWSVKSFVAKHFPPLTDCIYCAGREKTLVRTDQALPAII